jgi:hypothetical protein
MQRPRIPSHLSESVHHRLNMYAIAASAAGVGLLALAQPAQGKIIYTSTHKTIKVHQHYYLDLNHDGIVWAIENFGDVKGGSKAVLYAYDANGSSNSLTELYDSSSCHISGAQSDLPGPATKFSVPTIANGLVFVGTQPDSNLNQLFIYGELSTHQLRLSPVPGYLQSH